LGRLVRRIAIAELSYASTDTRLGAHMNESEKVLSEQHVSPDLAEVSRKTGLVVRSLDSAAVSRLFSELERYDAQERAETFSYLKRALNETRSSLGAEPIYRED
jgi:hypothetical protein